MAGRKKGIVEGAAEAAGDAAGKAADAVKTVAADAADKAADAAGAGLDAAKGALGAVGGMLGGLADKAADVAGDAADAARSAAGAVADGAEDLADKAADVVGDAADAAKGAAGAVADKLGAAGASVLGAGATLAGGAVAAASGAAKAAGTGASALMGTGAGGDGDRAGGALGAAGDGGGRGFSEIGAAVPVVLGAAAVVLLAWGGMHLMNNKWSVPPVPEAAAPAPVTDWVGSVGNGLKGQFGWLSLAAAGPTTVIASGAAPDAAVKQAALTAADAAVKAVPEGANALLIDNITVTGDTATPVGAALAALGASPDAAACGKAFVDTMAGRTINFNTGSADISADSASLLDALTGIGKACSAHTIAIEGHTDTVGTPENNLALSQARATAVKAYWEGKGLTGANITATGFGEGAALVPTPDETANEQNRRIEFKVTAAGG
jgi:outer membrane protein OmpA-like peptidoglycan-associated protein